jgi:hypothetical protein
MALVLAHGTKRKTSTDPDIEPRFFAFTLPSVLLAMFALFDDVTL